MFAYEKTAEKWRGEALRDATLSVGSRGNFSTPASGVLLRREVAYPTQVVHECLEYGSHLGPFIWENGPLVGFGKSCRATFNRKTGRQMTPKDWIAPGVIVAIMTVWLILSGGRFASIDTQYADIAARITEIDAKLDRNINGISATENQHGDIGKRIAELDAKLERSISSISAAEKQHGDIGKKIAEIDAKADRGFSSISKDDRYADLARRITELDASFERSMSGLAGRLDTAAQQAAALASQLGEMQAELNFLKRRLESLPEKLETMPRQPRPEPPATSPGD